MTDTPKPYSLRDLPTPAKLVITCYLLGVGLGYFSALVQLHLQHSAREGEALPKLKDVVEIFAGWREATDDDRGPPKSKLQRLIMGPTEGAAFNGSGTMAPAFFTRDAEGELGDKYSKQIKADPKHKEALDAERNGERAALDEWLKLPEDDRRATYTADKLPIPDALKGKPITPEALSADKAGIRVKLIMDARCARCHMKGGPQANFPLETLDQIAKYWVQPDKVDIVDGRVRSDRQMSIEALTQSTHAHLLSFAMLFSLTGLAFAFTSLPRWFRCIVAPMVVVAQIADVSCWWLARVDGVGVFFAMAIVGTGTITGIGLLIHIILGTLNMWTGKGRLLMALVLLVGAAGAVYVGVKVIQPALDVEKNRGAPKKAEKPAENAPAPQVNNAAVPPPNNAVKPAVNPVPANNDVKAPPAPMPPMAVGVSHLEKLIMGPRGAWGGTESMSAAFFGKDKKYKELVKKQPEMEKDREGEQFALQAWLKAPAADRKKAFDADAFALPADRVGKPITAEFLAADKKTVKVQAILKARCAACHGPEGEQEEHPLTKWDEIAKYFGKPPE